MSIEKELQIIEESLGHYSEIGGPDCPYHKTDDSKIRKAVKNIRDILNK